MKGIKFLAIFATCLLFLSSCNGESSDYYSTVGTVTSVSGSMAMTLLDDSDNIVTISSSDVSVSDLSVGDRLTITFTLIGDSGTSGNVTGHLVSYELLTIKDIVYLQNFATEEALTDSLGSPNYAQVKGGWFGGGYANIIVEVGIWDFYGARYVNLVVDILNSTSTDVYATLYYRPLDEVVGTYFDYSAYATFCFDLSNFIYSGSLETLHITSTNLITLEEEVFELSTNSTEAIILEE